MPGFRSSNARPPATPRRGYAYLSTRPLFVLIFLAPLIVAYELGSIRYLHDAAKGLTETVGAHSILARAFEALGGATLFLPGAAIAAVLVIWHLLERDPWRVRPVVLLGMVAESILWTAPLIVIARILGAHAPAMGGEQAGLAALPWQARLTLSIGAGIYEELLFRLIAIAVVHFLLVDLGKVRPALGGLIAVVASAAAFTVYHDVPISAVLSSPVALFYLVAGVYLGTLFLLRGFGIAVAVHACYDAAVLVAFPLAASAP